MIFNRNVNFCNHHLQYGTHWLYCWRLVPTWSGLILSYVTRFIFLFTFIVFKWHFLLVHKLIPREENDGPFHSLFMWRTIKIEMKKILLQKLSFYFSFEVIFIASFVIQVQFYFNERTQKWNYLFPAYYLQISDSVWITFKWNIKWVLFDVLDIFQHMASSSANKSHPNIQILIIKVNTVAVKICWIFHFVHNLSGQSVGGI